MADPIRAALASDGPAVPESREPASVVGESIDDAELDELFTEIDQSGEALSWRAYARAVLARWGQQPAPQPLSPSAQAADDSTLRDAALLALTTLEGWSNYDQWVWPISAMEQVRRGTTEAIAALRMALSRFAPPTEGELVELAVFLRDAAFDLNGSDPAKSMLTRAADLLEQRHPAPVPVSERPWEREGWCDDEGRCWIHCPGQSWDTWVLTVPQNAIDGAHCLPTHALPLPLPQGEVEK